MIVTDRPCWTCTKSLTVEQTRRLLAQAFRDAGLDTPDLDARLLVGHALGLDHAGARGAGRPRVSPAAKRTRSPRWPRAGSRTSRWRASSA